MGSDFLSNYSLCVTYKNPFLRIGYIFLFIKNMLAKLLVMKNKIFLIIHVFIWLSLSLSLITCKKSVTDNNPPIPPVADTGNLLNKNVLIIDSTKLVLTSDSSQLNQGHLVYTVIGVAPTINVNDIIVGATNGGYIRRVSSINQQQSKITIESTQGTMEDVFKNAKFSFTTGMDGLKEGRIMSDHSFDITGVTLYKKGPVTIKLDKGLITIGGDWDFDFDFEDSKLKNLILECKNASFNGQFDFTITADNTFNIVDTTVTLKRVAKYYTKFITIGIIPVPVIVYMEVELRGKLSASVRSRVDETFSINSNTTMDLGLSYANSQWQNIFTKNSSSSVSVNSFNDSLQAKIELGLIPYISFRIMRVAGPYASFGLRELVKGDISLPAGDWGFYAGAWLQTIIGARAGIFSKSWVDYYKEWNTDTIYYQTPYKIEKSLGDNQTGSANEFLNLPLKVKVLDNNGHSQSKVPVYFNVTAGGGSVETPTILTDKDGYAQTRWKIGAQNVIQTVEAKAKQGDGSLINGAPIEFAASLNPLAVATVSTNNVTSITATSAVSGGNITNDGGTPITARGVCWGSSANPVIDNNPNIKPDPKTGIGSFKSNITGLSPNNTYHVRAYATNGAGTAYGNDVQFTTQSNNLIITIEGTYIGTYKFPLQGTLPMMLTFYINNNNNKLYCDLSWDTNGTGFSYLETFSGPNSSPNFNLNNGSPAGTWPGSTLQGILSGNQITGTWSVEDEYDPNTVIVAPFTVSK